MASLLKSRAITTQHQQLQTTVSEPLTPHTGNGISTDLRDMLLYLSRRELIVAIGKFVAIQNTQTQELSFIGAQSNSVGIMSTTHGSSISGSHSVLGEITAMALSPKMHCLSVCRAAVRTADAISPATVTLYKIASISTDTSNSNRGENVGEPAAVKPTKASRSRGTWLKTMSFDAEKFVGTALSPDGKLVCCQTANSAWTLVVWDWSRARQIASVDVHCKVTRVRFNAIDMAQLSTSGSNVLRLWTLSEYTLKPFVSFKSGDETKVRRVVSYVDHAWLPNDALVALLEDGDIQLIINGELIQTLRSVHNGIGKLACMTALSNGEGVVVGGTHGLVTIVRVASKMMKADEKELHFQRRMRVRDTENILGLATDPTAATLLCCTERNYGTYDLSNLCLLRGDDDVISLEALSSTPFSTKMDPLSPASGRGCFVASCSLPGDEFSVNIWNQSDAHECYLSQTFEHSAPLALDIHPRGLELVVGFSSKLQIFFVLQDSLRLAFELPQKQISILRYSPTGSIFAGVHSSNKTIYLYQNCTQSQREPQLVGCLSRDFHDVLTRLVWSPHDSSFFVVDAAGETRHCLLQWQEGGEIEDLVHVHSTAKVHSAGGSILCLTSAKVDHDTHDYVIFAAETDGKAAMHGNMSLLRAWVNGDLSRDAIRGSTGHVGQQIPYSISTLAGSNSTSNLLFGGTSSGAVVIQNWRRGKLDHEGNRLIILSPVLRVFDLHTSPVVGIFFIDRSFTLLSNSRNGVVISSSVDIDTLQPVTERSEASQQIVRLLGDDTRSSSFVDSNTTFSGICQADEVGLYDRNKIELARLKAMDVESELQQLKLENEMLVRQSSEQYVRFEATLKHKIAAEKNEAEETRAQLRAEMSAKMEGAVSECEEKMRSLSTDARTAQDHYLYNTEKIQRECDAMQESLVAARQELVEASQTWTLRETELIRAFEKKLQTQQAEHESVRSCLQTELEAVKRKLSEVLGQQQQDYSDHMSLLSSKLESEKKKLLDQQAQTHGKVAGLNQEVKLLLAALTAKDHELGTLHNECAAKAQEIEALKAKIQDERRSTENAMKEKNACLAQYCELKGQYENLQRLDGVHRSQIEILQRHLLPKEQEIEKMQEYMNQLHDANKEIVIQANLSDRFRVETSIQAKKQERDATTAQHQLDRIRHSIEVLQEELGELVRLSAVQEKSALVGEIVRIHKRLTRQMSVLQARDDGSEEVNAELHRQTNFLLKDKQHQRRQLDMANQEKRKLAAALSFQNATLMTELNSLKRQNKELERRIKQYEANGRQAQTSHVRSATELRPEVDIKEGASLDTRSFLHQCDMFMETRDCPDERNTSLDPRKRKSTTSRPQSAASGLSRRPAMAGPRSDRESWSRKDKG